VKQPLVAVALWYGAGVILGHFVEAPLAGGFIAAFALAAAALVWAQARPCLLPFLLLLSGWLNLSSRTAQLAPHDLRALLTQDAQLVSVRARVLRTPVERLATRDEKELWYSLAELEVSEIRVERGTWQPAFGRLLARTPGHAATNVLAGQEVEISGVALRPAPPVAEGVFDYARYLRLRGIHYELKVESAVEWRARGAMQTPSIAERFRAWGQRTLARGLPGPDESLRLQWAMLLGWQAALTDEVAEPFMRSGTMHIFAISGLHIALIALIFVALLRAAFVPRVGCGLLVIPLLWFYTGVTGWQPSAIRSAVMMSVILAGWSLQRPAHLLNSLAAAALIILAWQPQQLFQAGFQLSFFVVLGLALLSPPIDRWRGKLFALDPLLPYELRPQWQKWGLKLGGHVWKFFVASLAALLASMPLIAYYFHLFTPGSLLANLVVVPVSSLALMSGLGALITGDALPWVTELFNHSGWFWMHAMIFLSDTAANLPGAWFHIRAPGPLTFAFYYGMLLAWCLGWLRHRARRWWMAGAFVVYAGVWLAAETRENLWHRLTVLPLGGGHAVHVLPRDDAEWLCNSGDRSAFIFTLKPYLQAQGVNRLDNFLLMHSTARNIGGVALLQETFPVRQAWTSPLPSRSTVYREALEVLERNARLRLTATNGDAVSVWRFLHPGAGDSFRSADDRAIVALGDFDGVRVLLAPDLGAAGQNAVFARHPDVRAEIVIAGLPASGEPLAAEWLAALRPRLIIIADSELPAPRRASRALAGRLRATGAEVC
jgi:competence protein ComEC